MGISISLKAGLSDSELSNIYLRYEEENRTKKKLLEITSSNPEPFALVKWLAYIAFGEEHIEIHLEIEELDRFIDECVYRIEQAIRFWRENRYQNYTSYSISLREGLNYNNREDRYRDYASWLRESLDYRDYIRRWKTYEDSKRWQLLE